jgi:hypothetical protein
MYDDDVCARHYRHHAPLLILMMTFVPSLAEITPFISLCAEQERGQERRG